MSKKKQSFYQIDTEIAETLKSSDASIIFAFLKSRARLWKKKQKNFNGWFFCTYEDIDKRFGIKRKAQQKAVDILIKYKLIETENLGMPAKRHFRVSGLQFAPTVQTSMSPQDEQEYPYSTNTIAPTVQTSMSPQDDYIKSKEIDSNIDSEEIEIACGGVFVGKTFNCKEGTKGKKATTATSYEIDKELMKEIYEDLTTDDKLIKAEFLKMRKWIDARPVSQRKTKRGMPRFIINWLDRAVKDQQQRSKNNANNNSTRQYKEFDANFEEYVKRNNIN